MIMDIEYQNSLASILEDECEIFGEYIKLNGVELKAIVGISPTTKNLQVAGFYKRKTVDVVIPRGVVPEINNVVIYNDDSYYVKNVEEFQYGHGYRFAMELIR